MLQSGPHVGMCAYVHMYFLNDIPRTFIFIRKIICFLQSNFQKTIRKTLLFSCMSSFKYNAPHTEGAQQIILFKKWMSDWVKWGEKVKTFPILLHFNSYHERKIKRKKKEQFFRESDVLDQKQLQNQMQWVVFNWTLFFFFFWW